MADELKNQRAAPTGEGDSAREDCGSVDKSRRQFNKIGLSVPVLASLASRPALGGACLSNIMSGNLSDPGRGNCQTGWSPDSWLDPGGSINGHQTLDAWVIALGPNSDPLGGHPYGHLPTENEIPDGYPPQCNGGGQAQGLSYCYVGGVTLDLTPLAACLGADDRPLRQILWEDSGTSKSHCVAAFLNAKLSENDPTFNYILTVQQVVDLCCGVQPVPAGWSLSAFLEFTWDEPHGTGEYVFPGISE